MKPLAERMRPQTLAEFVGQAHLTGKDAPIRFAIEKNVVPSMIFWGPPGSGKTTLAKLIAKETKREFFQLNAVDSGVKQIRDIVTQITKGGALLRTHTPILFIDEIHRFSKSQQDALLNIVENGTVVFIAATTENPSFEVIHPLLSRCQVYVLNDLTKGDMEKILSFALQNDELLKKYHFEFKEQDAIFHFSGGDARKLLNIIEMMVSFAEGNTITVTNEKVEKIIQQKSYAYDKKGENHYNIISAFIKSLRGSDPDAAVYWLARMLEGGEDIRFIARRLIILAAEDIGMANPNALLLANACFQSVNVVGMPEARIILSETVIYLSTSPKSNSSYMAIKQAEETVRKTKNLQVPLHLRNAPTKLMKEMDYGKNYKYAHNFKNNFVQQQYLPDEIINYQFYVPADNPKEKDIKKRMDFLQQKTKEK